MVLVVVGTSSNASDLPVTDTAVGEHSRLASMVLGTNHIHIVNGGCVQIQIDDCFNCEIFLGPVGGSAFFRDCKDCKVTVACQQFRTRDCENLDVSLYCSTKPIIETSAGVTFKPWNGAYAGLTSHFTAAGLDPEVNTWFDIYDFNQGQECYGQVSDQ